MLARVWAPGGVEGTAAAAPGGAQKCDGADEHERKDHEYPKGSGGILVLHRQSDQAEQDAEAESEREEAEGEEPGPPEHRRHSREIERTRICRQDPRHQCVYKVNQSLGPIFNLAGTEKVLAREIDDFAGVAMNCAALLRPDNLTCAQHLQPGDGVDSDRMDVAEWTAPPGQTSAESEREYCSVLAAMERRSW